MKNLSLFAGVASLLAVGSANAALDPAVTATITTGVADAATLGGLILALVVLSFFPFRQNS